ncbi:hypothetical protein D9M71_693400 [compost metagenome]
MNRSRARVHCQKLFMPKLQNGQKVIRGLTFIETASESCPMGALKVTFLKLKSVVSFTLDESFGQVVGFLDVSRLLVREIRI